MRPSFSSLLVYFCYLRLGDSSVGDDADLSACGVVAPTEGAIGVARYHAVVVSGFYVGVEGVGRGHIREVGASAGIQRPAFGEDDYLAELTAGDVAAPAEGAVCVTRDDAAVVRRL